MDMQTQLRALQFAGEVSHLTIAFSSALADVAKHAEGLPLAEIARRVATDPDVTDVWANSSDFPRRDYMTFCAETASRAGVTAETLRAAGDTAAVEYAEALVELATEQIAAAADPAASLIPEMPTMVARGPVGCYAVSTVCDSTEPEEDKILACALLIAAARPA